MSIRWTTPTNSEVIRCPYCVDGIGFKTMAEQPSGDWFVCEDCGHLVLRSNPHFRCTCTKCVALTQDMVENSSFSQRLRELLKGK